ncbi:MAG: dGTP triphosphohydrolase [Methanosarcina sp.]|jgi:dGTPase
MCPLTRLKQEFKKEDRFDPTIDDNSYLIKEELDVKRDGFSRDKDRILFSTAFRRLQHKAQVFSNEKSDHLRTRLTHTLEVSVISRNLAHYLGVNENLAEAIAVGHDIGHTPFGHEGERILDDILSGQDDLGGELPVKINYGGFKHNFHSIRVLDVVQKKYEDKKGLNLSWQVLEGILKHTKTKRSCRNECQNCGKCWNIRRFISDERVIPRLYLDYSFSVTVEGQIVRIADDIAQREHDLDDGFRSRTIQNVIGPEIISYCEEIINKELQTNEIGSKDSQLKHVKLLENLVEKLKLNEKSEDRYYRKETLIRDIIDYFIHDVYFEAQKQKENISYEYNSYGNLIIKKEIIKFSPAANELNKKLESLIKTRILNSWDVNKFDGKANYLIKQLFKAYYNNPLQMMPYGFQALKNKLEDNNAYYNLVLSESDLNIKDIDFKKDNRSDIQSVFSVLKLKNIDKKLNLPPDLQNPNIKELAERYNSLSKLSVSELENENDKFIKCIFENNHAFLSTISDYIAGMTDNFAKKSYEELY